MAQRIISSGVTSTGIILSGIDWMQTDTLNVLKGGTANSTTILNNGRMYVSSSGKANDTLVNGGGLIVLRGGTVTGTTVNSGGLVVSSGAEALAIRENGGCVWIDDGAVFSFVSNTISSLALSHSSATIHSGTTAVDTSINLGGSMYVFSGGIATGTAVSNGSLIISGGGTATDSVITPGGRLAVFSGGNVSGTTVNSGGWLAVFSGGSASGTTINSGGSVTLFSNGYASSMTLKTGGKIGGFSFAEDRYWEEIKDGAAVIAPSVVIVERKMVVSGGGNVSGVIVSGCSLVVSSQGIAAVTSVNYGTLVLSGGSATGTVVSGGSLLITSGGSATGTTVCLDGSLLISSGGSATDATLDSRCYLSVESGGYASAVTLKAGARFGSFLFAGDHYLEEIKDGSAVIAPSVTITGNEMVVSGGGSITGTTIRSYSDGSLVVSGGGVASSTTVNDHCSMCIYGSANDIIIYDSFLTVSSGGKATAATITTYGSCHVSNGGIVSGATVEAYLGRMYVFSGGIASDATVRHNGGLIISGGGTAVSANVDRDGSLTVLSGGIATGTTVNSGGGLVVSGGGMAVGAIVYSGGGIVVSSGGKASDIIVDGSGTGYSYCGLCVSRYGMISGTLQITRGSIVLAYQGAQIDFTIAEQSDPGTALINDWSLIGGGDNADYTITVKNDQAAGIYNLAGGAENFNHSISVKTTADTPLGYLTIGETRALGSREYTLNKEGSTLTLAVEALPAVSDYNRSGKSDMVQFVDGKVYVTHDTESGYVQTPAVNDVTGWNVAEIRRDLTGDGFADIQITSYDGASQTWVAMLRNDYLEKGRIELNYHFIGAYETELWSYLGSADVNADGKSEVLMVQTDAGADEHGHRNIAAWVTDSGGTWIGNDWVGSLTNEWNVAGTADVTGDGADNVILRRADGMIGYWSETGSNNIVEVWNAGESFMLTSGDFRGDGADDLLFSNAAGDFFTWTNISSGVIAERLGNLDDLGGSWTFAGAGDYNADGKDEILWYNPGTDRTAYSEANKENFTSLTVIA